MGIAGRVAIVPKGNWSADATYKRLDAVTYNNTLYFAKKEVPAGTATSNTEYWSKSIVGGASAIATTEDAGVVKPDGKSMSVDESGTLSINLDGTTITLDEAKNVIKLADTLKDKINGAFPAANLINNLTTTEAGFGLDARQGKALDDKITEINGSLENIVPLIQDCNIVNSHFAYAAPDTLHTPAAEGKTNSTISIILTVIVPMSTENVSINTQYSFTAVTGEIFVRTINEGTIGEWRLI